MLFVSPYQKVYPQPGRFSTVNNHAQQRQKQITMDQNSIQEITRISSAREVNEILKAHSIVGRPLIVIPDGYKVADSIEAHRATPSIQKFHFHAGRIDAFAMLVTRHCNDNTIISFDSSLGRFRCFVDFPRPGNNSWMQKLIDFSPCVSEQWDRMLKITNTWFSQQVFAEQINDAQDMFLDPPGVDAANFRDMLLRLECTDKATFSTEIDFTDHEKRSFLRVTEVVSGKGENGGVVELPSSVTLSSQYYENAPGAIIECEFRHKVKDGEVYFRIHKPVHDLEKIKRDQTAAIIEQVSTATTVSVFEFL